MNGESCELSNRIEEPDTKIEKKLAKIKIDFFDLFGVGGAENSILHACHMYTFGSDWPNMPVLSSQGRSEYPSRAKSYET